MWLIHPMRRKWFTCGISMHTFTHRPVRAIGNRSTGNDWRAHPPKLRNDVRTEDGNSPPSVGVALADAAGWREMLKDALHQTGGPLTKKERAWADAILSPRQPGRSKKGKAA